MQCERVACCGRDAGLHAYAGAREPHVAPRAPRARSLAPGRRFVRCAPRRGARRPPRGRRLFCRGVFPAAPRRVRRHRAAAAGEPSGRRAGARLRETIWCVRFGRQGAQCGARGARGGGERSWPTTSPNDVAPEARAACVALRCGAACVRAYCASPWPHVLVGHNAGGIRGAQRLRARGEGQGWCRCTCSSRSAASARGKASWRVRLLREEGFRAMARGVSHRRGHGRAAVRNPGAGCLDRGFGRGSGWLHAGASSGGDGAPRAHRHSALTV